MCASERGSGVASLAHKAVLSSFLCEEDAFTVFYKVGMLAG